MSCSKLPRTYGISAKVKSFVFLYLSAFLQYCIIVQYFDYKPTLITRAPYPLLRNNKEIYLISLTSFILPPSKKNYLAQGLETSNRKTNPRKCKNKTRIELRRFRKKFFENNFNYIAFSSAYFTY